MTGPMDVLTRIEAVLSRIEAAGVSVENSGLRLAAYSYDASNYRVPPLAVVFPRSVDDVVAVVKACAATRSTRRPARPMSIVEAAGCCGVAGTFGFEAEHYDVSMKVAQQALAPALERAAPGTPVLADGFSCSMQVRQLAPDRRSLHLAELIDPGTAKD
ncbi:hypothetical protein [Streptomyces scabichelini]|uniref:hypothetical protein n=1 Tax=Streptomyces scabichelini TaxID=2711217 RepID=UPI0019D05D69|nr:hypothetical protein [Streptomyces scabichelini]